MGEIVLLGCGLVKYVCEVYLYVVISCDRFKIVDDDVDRVGLGEAAVDAGEGVIEGDNRVGSRI